MLLLKLNIKELGTDNISFYLLKLALPSIEIADLFNTSIEASQFPDMENIKS